MGFFEYLSNNLLYLFLVIGAIILVIGGSVAGYFIVKNWDKIFKSKKKKSEKLDEKDCDTCQFENLETTSKNEENDKKEEN